MKKSNSTLYSIGHGARRIDEFINLLKVHGIEFVVDVRSRPRSRFNPQFNQLELKKSLGLSGIRYVFMGEGLGGLPKDPSCYDSKGHVDYTVLRDKEFFRECVGRLVTANEKKIRIACMCSEIDACDCHRSKLIGEALSVHNISMLHITKQGGVESQRDVIKRVINKSGGDLFSNGDVLLKSRKSYKQGGANEF